MEYYVCYFDNNCKLILLGPHYFVDKKRAPEDGFINKAEAESIIRLINKRKPDMDVLVLPRLDSDAMDRRKEVLEAMKVAERLMATAKFQSRKHVRIPVDDRDEYDRDYWRMNYSDRF